MKQRNMALTTMGDLKRQIEGQKNHDIEGEYEKSPTETTRRVIAGLKEDFENLINQVQVTAIDRQVH